MIPLNSAPTRPEETTKLKNAGKIAKGMGEDDARRGLCD